MQLKIRLSLSKTMSEKLHKVLARTGIGSRRQLETWIVDGRVKVNGKRAELGQRVELSDKISVDGKPIAATDQQRRTQPQVILYNKPEGRICTRSDPKNRPTVFEHLPKLNNARWVVVGRLDVNTSGLLLFTDDGELANQLMHPRTGLEREYMVRVVGKPSPGQLDRLKKGVKLDGQLSRFTEISEQRSGHGVNRWYRVVLEQGKYREVRRLWDKVGLQVSRLKRVRFGTIRLPRDLGHDQSRKLAPKQLEKLLDRMTAGDKSDNEYKKKKPEIANSRPARSRTRRRTTNK